MSDTCASCDRPVVIGAMHDGQCLSCKTECTIAALTAENARLTAENKGLADLAEDAIDGGDGQAALIEHLEAENARLLRTNGRRERHILRARLQEAGAPCAPEWITSVEMIYTEARVTQRVCSALRRAWAERDKARAIIATAPHGDACSMRVQAIFRDGCDPDCDCWKSRVIAPTEAR